MTLDEFVKRNYIKLRKLEAAVGKVVKAESNYWEFYNAYKKKWIMPTATNFYSECQDFYAEIRNEVLNLGGHRFDFYIARTPRGPYLRVKGDHQPVPGNGEGDSLIGIKRDFGAERAREIISRSEIDLEDKIFLNYFISGRERF